MPAGQLVALLIVAVVVNVILMVLVVVPPILGRRSPLADPDEDGESVPTVESLAAGRLSDGRLAPLGAPLVDGVPTEAYDRVVRVVSFVFILAVAMVVAITGMWPDTEPAILGLLAVAGLFVLLIHDVMPPRVLGSARFVAEGSVAITAVTLLVALTGREQSPFFFAFALIVAGAALVVDSRVTIVLAVSAAFGYLAAIGIRPPGSAIPADAVATIGVNLCGLVLLAYVAMVISREQRRSRDAAIRLSSVDSLTDLYNRSFFFAALDREIQRCARTGRGFCLLMMDLDGLKALNDRYGHFHGDRALRIVGDMIRAGVRRIDIAARYGGDEFVALLPETDPRGAAVLAEKIRQGVADKAIPATGFDIRTSLSIGVVVFPDDGRTADELMIAADRAMYVSKRLGKNRVAGRGQDLAGIGVMDGPGESLAVAGRPARVAGEVVGDSA